MTEQEKKIAEERVAVDSYCESHNGCNGCVLSRDAGCAVSNPGANEELKKSLSEWRSQEN